ncbi:unnamed protein product [Parajaminaea phylloscopi]
MTVPPLDHQYPLCAQPLPAERLPVPGADPTPFLLALVRQAFALVRSADAWKAGKEFGVKGDPKQGGSVQSLSCPSDMAGRLKKCGWHARHSRHNRSDGGLGFEDFFDGLGTDQHTPNEAGYIPDLIETVKIATVIPHRAEIWRNSYRLPVLTGNRDFVELVVTLPLPPSPEPFSKGHEEVVVQQLSSQNASAFSATPQNATAHGPEGTSRSFVVISVPVAHEGAPERPHEFVRAKYCSVEAVWEARGSASASAPVEPTDPGAATDASAAAAGKHDTTSQEREKDVEWLMAVQSDSAGRVPLVFQEMAMPGKISADVPLFFKWARDRKDQGKGTQ